MPPPVASTLGGGHPKGDRVMQELFRRVKDAKLKIVPFYRQTRPPSGQVYQIIRKLRR